MFTSRRWVVAGVAALAVSAGGIGIISTATGAGPTCDVSYSVATQWNSGFTGAVTIKNTGSAAVSGWTLGWSFPGGQKITQGWNGDYSQAGAAVSVRNAAWNGSIAVGGSATTGFNASHTGANPVPTSFTLNGQACSVNGSMGGTPTVTAAPTSAPPAPTTAPTTSTPVGTPVDKSCAKDAALTMSPYWVNNNQWGSGSGAGSQCVWRTTGAGSTIGWGTSWNWTGQENSVKSYASVISGWHWGVKVPGSGLPVQLSAGKDIASRWDYTVNQQTPNTMNVSYDLWLHPMAGPTYADNPTDEVMIWTYRSGGAGPVGTKQTTVTVDGTSWDLYKGYTSWNVFSFVRTSNTSSSTLNIKHFTDELTKLGWLSASKYLTSIEAGTEVFTGTGQLDTSAYSVSVGSATPPATTSGAATTTAPTAAPTTPPTTPAAPTTPVSTGTAGALGTGRIQYGPTYRGDGTFYGATGEGNCLYDASSDRMVTAMNAADYENSQACGAYLQVTGPTGKTITVKVVDQCPECKPGDLDLSQEAFAQLAAPSAGRIAVSWKLVSPALSGPVGYRYKEGSSQWWCGVQVRNHRNPVRSLELKVNGSWKVIPRTSYNYFVSADGAGCGGDLRVTDIYGNQVSDTGITLSPGKVQQGKAQFAAPR